MYAGALSAGRANEMKFDTAYLPISAFAQHGPRLPFTTSILIARALSEEISTQVNAFMLPVQPFGSCVEHDDKYSVGVDSGLMYEMTLDLARELKRQGFRRLILHKGYAGLSMLYPLTRHLNAAEGMQTAFVDPCALVAAACTNATRVTDACKSDVCDSNDHLLECADDFHAGELHTSLMMYLYPNLVKMDIDNQAKLFSQDLQIDNDEKSSKPERNSQFSNLDFIPKASPGDLDVKPFSLLCPEGVWGRPSLASAEKGAKIFREAVRLTVESINDAFSFMGKNGDYVGSYT